MPKKNQNNFASFFSALTFFYLAKENNELKKAQKSTCEMAARSILMALDCKDHYTFGHSMRVSYFSLLLGQELGLKHDELYQLEFSSLFHDIGKIGIPDSILLKPGRLSEEEFQMMKTHPEKSAEILQGFSQFEKVAYYAKHHHERFDGRGYPSGLKKEEIPLYSRIILIADTFDAITSTRPYRKGLPYKVAFDELEQFIGSQFDPDLVKYYIKALSKEEPKKNKTFKVSLFDQTFYKDVA